MAYYIFRNQSVKMQKHSSQDLFQCQSELDIMTIHTEILLT